MAIKRLREFYYIMKAAQRHLTPPSHIFVDNVNVEIEKASSSIYAFVIMTIVAEIEQPLNIS